MKSWQDIPRFPSARYAVDVPWDELEHWIARQTTSGLDMDPDFQRAHVWTDAQRAAYVEYALQGADVGRTIWFVCRSWNDYPKHGFAICDGKQRIETVRRFMRGEFGIFPDAGRPEGYRFAEFAGRFPALHYTLRMCVAECATRADALRLYLKINAGGTPHAPEEIDRVRALLAAEESETVEEHAPAAPARVDEPAIRLTAARVDALRRLSGGAWCIVHGCDAQLRDLASAGLVKRRRRSRQAPQYEWCLTVRGAQALRDLGEPTKASA